MRIFENHTDSELIKLARANVQGAFKEIFERYSGKLFRYAHARVNNREDCKELVQEVFEVIWKSDKEIHQLRPFLYTVLKFRIINFYEHKSVIKKFSDYISQFKSDMVIVDDKETEIVQLRSVINRTLKELPARCQETVRLRIDEELSLDEIAIRMNVTKASVKQYLTVAMNYFRKVHSPIYRIK